MTATADFPLVASEPRGRTLIDALSATDHLVIGKRYLVTAFTFLFLGGLLAVIMRLQLARPLQHVVGPDLYNQIFTVHGSTMMFLFAVPVMQGLGIYFVPLMIGTKNVAFPRLTALSYWMYLFGGLFLWIALFSNTGPDTGWFAYVPLSGPQYAPGKRVDVWAQMITMTEISALASSSTLIATIFKYRAPGMSLDRMPLFVWSQLVTAFMIVFAMPAVVVASGMLALDRLVQTQFFNPVEGGDAILYQHLFWFFGHPEVYIIFIPALGMVSTIIVSETRRRIFAYTPMVLSLVTTAIVGFGLWVHHMFATGLPQVGASFFTAASLIIAIPTGVQIFCWIATIWTGKPRLSTAFLFVGGFFAIFIVGGLTGVMLGSVPIDLQVHDTFFVVAHLHYVLIGGALFPLFGALYHWVPKITGRLLDERLGRWNFGLMFIGFNLAFFPQHILGLHGMPRRIYTYLPETGWGPLNMLSSIGAFTLGIGILLFVANFFRSLRSGELAGNDPWGADTLEWLTTSPPPTGSFAQTPTVGDRYPLWATEENMPGHVVGLAHDEQLVTTLVTAEPDHKTKSPEPSIWPFVTGLATAIMIVAAIFTPWAVPVGAVPIGLALAVWFWPRRPRAALVTASASNARVRAEGGVS